MASFNKIEFWKELDATDEGFVRRKFAVGGYSLAKQKLVVEWIKVKDDNKRAEREGKKLRAAMLAARWTQVSAIATGFATFVALIALFWPK